MIIPDGKIHEFDFFGVISKSQNQSSFDVNESFSQLLN
jgi:hypothetical protein